MNNILPVYLFSLCLLTLASPVRAEEALTPGEKTVLPIILEKREIRWIKSSGLSGYKEGEAAIAVPKGFDPEKTYPVFVTCVTGDRYMSNIQEMDKYWPQAIEAGWIVVTGWAEPHPERDTKAYRRAVTVAAMRKLEEIIPSSRTWPVAVGGFSGGSKNAAIIAAYLQEEGYRLAGLFMGGCNQDLASHAMRRIAPDETAFREMPVFMSTGKSDRISTVSQSKKVMESLEESGFAHRRLETYDGVHRLHGDHVTAALNWFASFLKE